MTRKEIEMQVDAFLKSMCEQGADVTFLFAQIYARVVLNLAMYSPIPADVMHGTIDAIYKAAAEKLKNG